MKLLKLSDGAIKGADSHAKVMFAGMPGYSSNINAWDFLEPRLQKQGAAKAFDVAALHPYAHNVKQMLGEVKRFRRVMQKHGDGHTPLWITEIGWGSLPKKADAVRTDEGQEGPGADSQALAPRAEGEAPQLAHQEGALVQLPRPEGRQRRALQLLLARPACSSTTARPKPSWKAFKGFTH